MISNQGRFTRPQHYTGGRPYSDRPSMRPGPATVADRRYSQADRPQDEILATETVETERKTFTLSLRKNRNGQFVRVDENRGQAHNVVIIPIEATEQFRDALARLQTQQA